MIEPPMPSKSMNVLDWCYKVWRYIRATTPKAGPGLKMVETPTGTIFSLAPQHGGTVTGPDCAGFRLARGAENDQLTVSESTIIGAHPSGFTEGKKTFTISTADGKIYGKIHIATDGTVSAADVLQGSSVPADGSGDYYREIGTFHVEGTGSEAVLSFTQTNCGPLDASVCRNWFAAAEPYYGVSWH